MSVAECEGLLERFLGCVSPVSGASKSSSVGSLLSTSLVSRRMRSAAASSITPVDWRWKMLSPGTLARREYSPSLRAGGLDLALSLTFPNEMFFQHLRVGLAVNVNLKRGDAEKSRW